MSWTAKTAIILLCFLLCSAGTFIASTTHEKRESHKANVIPVKNYQTTHPAWLRV